MARGYTPTPALSHAILTYNRGRHGRRWPTASSSRLRTIRPTMAASSTIRRTAGRPIPLPRSGSRTAPTSSARPACATCAACPTPARSPPPPRIATITFPPTSTIWAPVRGSGRRRAARASSLGADPLGGAGVAYWGRIAERYGLKLDHTAHDHPDPTFRFMRARLGRQDPHGLLLALRHGGPDRAEGQIRRGLRLRYRPRPPRHRDAQRRAAESQSLPGGGHLVSVSQIARAGARTPESARRWFRAA